MPNEPWFELAEEHAFGGHRSWRLKNQHIRFRGKTGTGEPFPAMLPVPARKVQIARFVAVLDFLQVWEWKQYYPECFVYDGMSWTFTAAIDGRKCKTGGCNAYPSFVDPAQASFEYERYALLVLSLRSIFHLGFDGDFLPQL